MVLARVLEITLKAEVAAAASAEEAFAYLQDHPLPDLILMDAVMPGMDGYQACAKLRADARYRAIPIIFLSARSLPSETERARAAGATACLSKPFDPLTIGDEIEAVLEASAAPTRT